MLADREAQPLLSSVSCFAGADRQNKIKQETKQKHTIDSFNNSIKKQKEERIKKENKYSKRKNMRRKIWGRNMKGNKGERNKNKSRKSNMV